MSTRAPLPFFSIMICTLNEGKGLVPVEKNISVKYEGLFFDIKSIKVFLKLEYTMISCT